MNCGRLMSPEKQLRLELSDLNGLNKFKGVKILSLNIRSLLAKINLLRTDLYGINFDALAICETWLKPLVDDNLISIEDYQIFRSDRSTLNMNGDIKAGGGLLIYCSNMS